MAYYDRTTRAKNFKFVFYGNILIIFRWYTDKSSTFSAEQLQMIATKAK